MKYLHEVQQRLCKLYDLPDLPPVGPFLCTEEQAAQWIEKPRERGEALFVSDSPETHAHVALYIRRDALDAVVGREDPWSSPYDRWAVELAWEGVSHFTHVAFREWANAPVRAVELEMQGEVDKYMLGLFAVAPHQRLPRSQSLRWHLFELPLLMDVDDHELHTRYRTAIQTASAYCKQLETQFVRKRNWDSLLTELRRYYRSGFEQKRL